MRTFYYRFRHTLNVLVLLSVSLSLYSQSEISFTNKVVFSREGDMTDLKLVTLIPAPITNEYQEISKLSSNCGRFIDLNAANKVLFYDGSFEDENLEVFESFIYTTKKVTIDFADKTNKNISTGIDPNNYLGSDGCYIDLENNTIKEIGNQLWNQSNDILDYARKCYEYVAKNFSYINGSWRSLAQILEEGGGECGDFTTLFVNLMRYKGIPARHNIGVWVNGGYHVWPDFYHEDYGWVPLDPTSKNVNPKGNFFGRYDGNLIILSQGLTSFKESDIEVQEEPLQTFMYWFWYMDGSGYIDAVHETSKDYQVDAIENIASNDKPSKTIYSLSGIKHNGAFRGITIKNGKKFILK